MSERRMSHKSNFTTNGSNYARRTQKHARYCELFEPFVFCHESFVVKINSLLGQLLFNYKTLIQNFIIRFILK